MFFRGDGSSDGITLKNGPPGPPWHQLRQVRRRICVVSGASKINGLRGALAAGLATDLILDEARPGGWSASTAPPDRRGRPVGPAVPGRGAPGMGRVVTMITSPRLSLNNGVLIDQLGFGLYKVPPEDAARLVARPWKPGTGISTRRPCTATNPGWPAAIGSLSGVEAGQRRVRRGRPALVARGPLRHHQGLERRPRLRRDTARVRHVHGQPRTGVRGHVPDPLALRQAGTVPGNATAPWKRCTAKGRYGRSAYPTSSHSTWTNCWRPPKWYPPSTRSSCTPGCSRPNSGRSTASWESSPRPGARWAAARCWRIPSSWRSPPSTSVTPAQIILRWQLQLGNITIPKASSVGPDPGEPGRFRLRTLRRWTWRTSQRLDRGYRTGSHPDNVN